MSKKYYPIPPEDGWEEHTSYITEHQFYYKEFRVLHIKYLFLLIFISVSFAGCNLTSTKQSLLLECEEGKVVINWYIASMVSNDLDIKQPKYLAKSGFYKNDKGNYMKCIKE